MTAPHILVVDDEPDIRELVKEILEDEKYTVSAAADGESARQARRERRPDLILLDIWMPDIDGLSLFKEWQADDEDSMPPVVIMSGHGTVETAVEATRLGAYDFLEKPLSMSKLLLTIRHALDDYNLRRENAGLRRHVQPLNQPLGKSEVMEAVRAQAIQVAGSDATVLLVGEPGVGKRLVARYIHQQSGRSQGPFVEVGTKSHSPDEMSSKLFGEEDGDNVRYGLLEQANGGCLFLNEIADLDMALQGELAAALQSGQFVRRGGTAPVSLDVRVIASTRKSLPREVKAGVFREDLFYQLNVVPIAVPPLREHRDDISELLTYYVDYFVESESLAYRAFSVAAQNKLRNHSWPGNVREFVNLVHRLMILSKGEIVESAEVEQALGSVQAAGVIEIDHGFDLPLRQARDLFEKSYFEYHLRVADGNVSQVAKKAGIERTHLYRKMKALGINPKEEA